ncbi:MAG: phosphatidylglycerophosphatase A [Rhodocyclaceae bacterium]|jgi:phosphatidylglycerophosphatase A|nr:phosphatidylglycerophosphatase A [Rhodocyclaceae bacterium]
MKNSPIPKGFMLSSPWHFIALGFGTGLSPRAPGTVGTLVGLPLFLLLDRLPLPYQIALIAGLFVAGCHICDVTGKALNVPDHGGIVWDEIVAFCMVLMTVPAHWAWWLAAFVAFRFFDIVKPPPIHWFDRRFKNGFGVMFDDLLAAIYAIASLALLQVLY